MNKYGVNLLDILKLTIFERLESHPSCLTIQVSTNKKCSYQSIQQSSCDYVRLDSTCVPSVSFLPILVFNRSPGMTKKKV